MTDNNGNNDDNNTEGEEAKLNPDETFFNIDGIIDIKTGKTRNMHYKLDDKNNTIPKEIMGKKDLKKPVSMFTRAKNYISNTKNIGGKSKKNGKKSNKKLRKTIKIQV